MNTIPLADAMIIWDDLPPAGEPAVVVVDTKQGRDDDRYSSSWGASNMEFNDADEQGKLLQLFVKYHQLVTVYGHNPQEVHTAFMVIPEYRVALAEAGSIDPASIPESSVAD